MGKEGMSRLEELRRKKGYTQIKMQMLTGVSQSDYSRIERGIREMTFWQCKLFAEMFDTSMDYIAGLTDEPRAYPKSKK